MPKPRPNARASNGSANSSSRPTRRRSSRSSTAPFIRIGSPWRNEGEESSQDSLSLRNDLAQFVRTDRFIEGIVGLADLRRPRIDLRAVDRKMHGRPDGVAVIRIGERREVSAFAM